jgi:hypothetical protein
MLAWLVRPLLQKKGVKTVASHQPHSEGVSDAANHGP